MTISTFLSFTTGILSSTIPQKPSKPLIIGALGTFSLFYTGSIMEFDNLVTMRPVKKSSVGYWMLCGGVMCAGLMGGGLVRAAGGNVLGRIKNRDKKLIRESLIC
ncbi:hypothetical protein THOM_0211 [Trachipleistophora hominis]|uniref:Uncharacterized protein n=1 Tax=Trachipleistophora hominis TaxID=72359 RepID=L7K0I1_TRAHO|nr:hypothetical protein THOM_0211 [Trachipleistophora hominis]